MKRFCFICDKPIAAAMSGGEFEMDLSDPPNDATCWHTRGNYGSTIIDSFGDHGATYEICICDECVKQRSAKLAWYYSNSERKVTQMGTGFEH